MRKKKNRFLVFLCSWIPGGGEMYLGFMKRGISLLGMFMLGIMIATITNIGVLTVLPLVVWVYSFFEANNLGALDDDKFYQVEDIYLFGIDEAVIRRIKGPMLGKYSKVAAVILILLGINLLWDVFCGILYDIFRDNYYFEYIYTITRVIGNNVTRAGIGILIIWLGIKLIKGKKEELEKEETLNQEVTGICGDVVESEEKKHE